MTYTDLLRKLQRTTRPSVQLLDEIIRGADAASDEQLSDLARILADSGARRELKTGTADLASTGGPASLSTLLGPLILVANGFTVPKVGVPGRPAGAIDTMAQIDGYKINLSEYEFEHCLQRSSYAHVIADRFASLDGVLFARRREIDAVAIPALAMASLLSKKLAVGVETVVLDIRVSHHGNFGTSVPVARRMAARFRNVASMCGINAVTILTDGEQPAQPFIGRGESLVALQKLLTGSEEAWLRSHSVECLNMVQAARTAPIRRGFDAQLRQAFVKNLEVQGSSWEAFETRHQGLLDEFKSRRPILMERDGYPTWDLKRLRSYLVAHQGEESDLAGIELTARADTLLSAGEPAAWLRLPIEAENPTAAQLGLTTEPTPSCREKPINPALRI